MNSIKFKPTSMLSLNKIKSFFLKKNPWKPTQIKPQSKPNNHLNQKPTNTQNRCTHFANPKTNREPVLQILPHPHNNRDR